MINSFPGRGAAVPEPKARDQNIRSSPHCMPELSEGYTRGTLNPGGQIHDANHEPGGQIHDANGAITLHGEKRNGVLSLLEAGGSDQRKLAPTELTRAGVERREHPR